MMNAGNTQHIIVYCMQMCVCSCDLIIIFNFSYIDK